LQSYDRDLKDTTAADTDPTPAAGVRALEAKDSSARGPASQADDASDHKRSDNSSAL